MIQAIVFDFDGVLVESVDTKTQAFRTLFASEGENVERIVSLHLQHGGRSRYQKFAMIYRDILRREPASGEFESLGRRFESLVCDAVVSCPFVAGAREFLEEWSGRMPMLVVSGTPHNELVTIVERRGLACRFLEVHGSPPEKEEIADDILARCGWPAAEVLFVGDAMTDWRAAVHAGMTFVGRVPSGAESPFPVDVPTIPDLTHLATYLDHVES